MCLITVLPAKQEIKKEIDTNLLKNAWYWNEDGAGMSFVDYNFSKEPCVKIYKNYESFKKFENAFKRLREINPKSMFMIHLRNSSMGESFAKINCHPFWIFKNKLSMCHNGTLAKVGAKRDSGPSDSNMFAEMLSKLPPNFLKNTAYRTLLSSYLGETNRLAFLSDNNLVSMFGKGWIKEDDIYFSNDYYKREIPKTIISTNFPLTVRKYECNDCKQTFEVHQLDWYRGERLCKDCKEKKVQQEIEEKKDIIKEKVSESNSSPIVCSYCGMPIADCDSNGVFIEGAWWCNDCYRFFTTYEEENKEESFLEQDKVERCSICKVPLDTENSMEMENHKCMACILSGSDVRILDN